MDRKIEKSPNIVPPVTKPYGPAEVNRRKNPPFTQVSEVGKGMKKVPDTLSVDWVEIGETGVFKNSQGELFNYNDKGELVPLGRR